jgi:hypothetical protein
MDVNIQAYDLLEMVYLELTHQIFFIRHIDVLKIRIRAQSILFIKKYLSFDQLSHEQYSELPPTILYGPLVLAQYFNSL